jgi:16S rRNA (adenine1518-N6/adenine1519-N6)-dimethyltransferase
MIDRSSRRRFGQNYLSDKSVIYQIVDKINPAKEDSFIEIGPGQGAITEGIKNNSKNLTLIEIDRKNVAYLKSSLGNEIEIFEEDVLKIDLSFIKNNDRIVGNLPYNIASQIILRFLELNNKIFDMHFMVQKEMAEVLTSSPGNKSWNKFAVKVAFFYETEILMDISPEAFDIKPKVDSSLVRFKPINSQAFEIKKLFQIIDLSFQSKRKTIFNNLKKHNINWEKLKFDKNLRAEQLSLEDFLEIYKNA